MSGLPFWLYWGSHAAVDMIKYLLPIVVVIIVTVIAKVNWLDLGGNGA